VFSEKSEQKTETIESFLIKEIEASNFSLKDFNNVDLENKKIGITFRSGYI
jgi:hypothetical protein